MKMVSLVLLFVTLFHYVDCVGQVYVDGVAIDTVNIPFIQLIGSNGGDFNRTNIIIDYGQRAVSTAFSRQRIAGPDKQPMNFKSTVDALNFVTKQGWELVAFDSSASNVYIYVLQRKKRAAE